MDSFLVLLPPLLVLFLSLKTKKIVPSLLIGIVTSALIVTELSPKESILLIINHACWLLTATSTLYFVSLLLTLGTIIVFITKTGGAQALGNIIVKKANSAKKAQLSTLLLSTSLFIDDYLNTLTVGPVMKNLTDRFAIPRVKLAYFVGTMAGSLIILAPISSWLGVLVGQFESSGIHLGSKALVSQDPFFAYLATIPFIFYPLITIASNFFITFKNISYGPMKKYEEIELEKIKDHKILNENKNQITSTSLIDFTIPVFTLITLTLLGLPYTGGYKLFGGNYNLIESLQHSNSSLVLLVSSIIALILSLVSSLLRHKIKIKDIQFFAKEGVELMIPSATTILLAWLFGEFLNNDLKTGSYLANLVLTKVHVVLIPAMVFLTSLVIALAIGSTWATMALMVPIVIPMIISFKNITLLPTTIDLPLLYACIGAIFSGATAGNHLSPISDSTIMASTSTDIHISDYIHVRSLYILPSIIGSIIAYLTCGMLIESNFLLASAGAALIGTASSYSLLIILNKLFSKK